MASNCVHFIPFDKKSFESRGTNVERKIDDSGCVGISRGRRKTKTVGCLEEGQRARHGGTNQNKQGGQEPSQQKKNMCLRPGRCKTFLFLFRSVLSYC